MNPASDGGPRLGLITSQAYSLVNFRGPLVRAAVARGVTVFALAPDFSSETRRSVAELGAIPVDISLSRAGIHPLRDTLDTLRLAFVLRSLKLDITLSYFIKPVIYGLAAATLARVPKRMVLIEGAGYVYGQRGKRYSRRWFLRPLISRLYRLALSRAHRVFLLNRDDHRLFVGGNMVAADKVVMLGAIGLELERYQPASPPAGDAVSFIMVARMLREKGVLDYIEAARRLHARYAGVRFFLVGGVDENPGSLSVAELSAHIQGTPVEWTGHVPDVRPWLGRASVFVLPSSYREGVPRSTQEAMAMGLPVITTDWTGCRDTVDPGRNGFLVPVRDVQALVDAMARCVEDPGMLVAMGEQSRIIAEERFDVRRSNGLLLAELGLGSEVKESAIADVPG